MPWRGPEVEGEVPSLGPQIIDFIEEYCVNIDGLLLGQNLRLSAWQIDFLLNFYRLHPDAEERYRPDSTRRDWTRPSRAFFYDRGGQVVYPQKSGKSPFGAVWLIAEAAGPVLFDGWDARGEPVGRPWIKPWCEIAAVSEDQAANTWRALLATVREGPLANESWDVGESRINLPGGGVIRPVTASARSRLGARLTGAVQDETHDWTKTNGGRQLADNQRRNLAGMGGRWMETSNAWEPSEGSVAQATFTAGEGVFKCMAEAGPGNIRNKQDRMEMLERVYEGSWWVDPERISSEIDDLIGRGEVAQAERFFLNRIVPGEDRAFDAEKWAAATRERVVPKGALITLGVDGARYEDALAIVATEVETGYQWIAGLWERPKFAGEDYEHPLDEVNAVVEDLFEQYDVWRLYADPGSQTANISILVEKWQGRWTDKKVFAWLMSRPRPAALMIRRFASAIISGDLTHEDNPDFARHIQNARRKRINAVDDEGLRLWTVSKDAPGSANKIDASAAAALSWEARGDAVAANAQARRVSAYADQMCRCGNPDRPHLKSYHR